MNELKISRFVVLLIFPLIFSCSGKKSNADRIVIGIASDIQTINPLFTFNVYEGSITELLYLGLFDFKWNDEKGELDILPMIAKEWNWTKDSLTVRIKLRSDVFWTDGKQLTSDDIVYSFDIYSDPIVQSRLYGSIETLFIKNHNQIDIQKSFTIISPLELEVHFSPTKRPALFDLGVPILPKHVFEKINREELAESDKNYEPVSSGPYKFFKWDKNQDIILTANKSSFLFKAGMVNQLVFKIIPDYTSRINQLEKNEIDILELVKTEDIKLLSQNNDLIVKPVNGREYDYIGWNNIDAAVYQEKNSLLPNKLFGDPQIRRALSFAINRKEIIDEYLLGYAEIANSPVSSIFKKEINPDLVPLEYDPQKSKSIFKEKGWWDSNNNGIIDKNGTEFSFTLSIPTGNPLREYAATLIRNDLRSVGINMDVEKSELGVFVDNLYNKSMDAWMAAWYIPIPIQFKPYWHSDAETAPLNFVSYQSSKADKILDRLDQRISDEEYIKLIHEFQKVLYDEQPVTFLYWIPNITAYNKRIKNIEISPYGVVTHCWEWRIANNNL